MSEASSIQSSPKAAVSQPQPRIPSKSEPQLALQSVTSSLAPGHLHSGGLQTDRSPSAESLQSEVRRSASIPQIRGIHPKKTGTISSPTDKRRNKLGYQRSSMACGHCRRRKIRCVPPTTEDPHGRCANCIRLKKECMYVPVDHAGELRPPGRREMGSVSSAAGSPHSPIPPGPDQLAGGEPLGPRLYEHSHNSSVASLNGMGPSVDDRSMSMPYLHGSMAGDHSPSQPNFHFPRHSRSGEWPASGPPGQHAVGSPYWASPESTPSRPSFPPNALSSIASSPNPGAQLESPNMAYQGDHPWNGTRSASFSDFNGGYGFQEVDGLPFTGPGAETEGHEGGGLQPNGVSHTVPMPNSTQFLQPWSQAHPMMAQAWYAEPLPMTSADGEAPSAAYTNIPHFFGGQHGQ